MKPLATLAILMAVVLPASPLTAQNDTKDLVSDILVIEPEVAREKPTCTSAYGFLVRLEVRSSRFDSWGEMLRDLGVGRDSDTASELLELAGMVSVARQKDADNPSPEAEAVRAETMGRIFRRLEGGLAEVGSLEGLDAALADSALPAPPGHTRHPDGSITSSDLGRLVCLEFDAAYRD